MWSGVAGAGMRLLLVAARTDAGYPTLRRNGSARFVATAERSTWWNAGGGIRLPTHQADTGTSVQLRLFVAMAVPADPARQLAGYAEELAAESSSARMTDPAAMHFTFAFLGDVAEDDVEEVVDRLEDVAIEVPGPALCSIARLSAFAGGRVLGVEVDVDLLTVLDAGRDRFLDAVANVAPGADRRAWRPHVTIVRTRRGAMLPVRAADDVPPPPAVSWVVPELGLYASLPGPAGHQHRMLHAVPFGARVRGG